MQKLLKSIIMGLGVFCLLTLPHFIAFQTRVAFKLSNMDMYQLGNTSDPQLNLYGK